LNDQRGALREFLLFVLVPSVLLIAMLGSKAHAS